LRALDTAVTATTLVEPPARFRDGRLHGLVRGHSHDHMPGRSVDHIIRRQVPGCRLSELREPQRQQTTHESNGKTRTTLPHHGLDQRHDLVLFCQHRLELCF